MSTYVSYKHLAQLIIIITAIPMCTIERMGSFFEEGHFSVDTGAVETGVNLWQKLTCLWFEPICTATAKNYLAFIRGSGYVAVS